MTPLVIKAKKVGMTQNFVKYVGALEDKSNATVYIPHGGKDARDFPKAATITVQLG